MPPLVAARYDTATPDSKSCQCLIPPIDDGFHSTAAGRRSGDTPSVTNMGPCYCWRLIRDAIGDEKGQDR